MSNIIVKTPEEIEIIRQNGSILHTVLHTLAEEAKPGVTTQDLDYIAYDLITTSGGTPSFKGYQGFPASICASVNDEVVHGIPNDRELQEGDILSIDCGVYKNEFHSDSAITIAIGSISEEAEHLMNATKKALYKAINAVKPGKHVGIIGNTVESYITPLGYGIVRDLVGHGLGRDIHEMPQIPNFGSKLAGEIIQPGMVFAIEPMITNGSHHVHIDRTDWVVKTIDGSLSAHFEHTIAVTETGARILTD